MVRNQLHLAVFASLIMTTGASAQPANSEVSIQAEAVTSPPLADYVGTYAYQGGSVELIASDELFAVLDGAKYKLRRKSGDVFVNGGGADVIFRRGADGRVISVEDETGKHARLSEKVSARTDARSRPRPVGAVPYKYSTPENMSDGIPVGDVGRSDLGLAAARDLVGGVLNGTWDDVDSVLIFQGGKLVLEEYFYGYDSQTPHPLRSATKSVVSAVVGTAVDRGLLSLDQPILERLGYSSVDNPDARKSTITLRDVLTMRSGLDCDDHAADSPGGEGRLYGHPDWVKAMIDLRLVEKPGTVGHYCSGNVMLAGRAVEKATGRKLPDYAQAHLFGPLGIRRSDWVWNYELTSSNKEFSQIHLRPRDMLKLGILYANKGRWAGKQVLPRDWVNASLAPVSVVENTGYGYYWWRMFLQVQMPDGPRKVYMSAAQGNGGQKIYIVPELDLVAVFTGSAYNAGGAPPNKMMVSVVLPALLSARQIKGDVGAPAR